jgi:pyruvate/2-oxoglutarate/acetoin dehydrogenase E1 component
LSYFDRLTEAMCMLAKHPKTVFVGQGVVYDGQRSHGSFANVPIEKRIEMPVVEDFQMGFCTGLALQGYIPVSFYPRMDFLLLAANQLVNHLDKWGEMSGVTPKVIIRTAVGSVNPLNPGPQHCQNHIEAFRLMLKNTLVLDLEDEETIVSAYQWALGHPGPVLLVEHMERY